MFYLVGLIRGTWAICCRFCLGFRVHDLSSLTPGGSWAICYRLLYASLLFTDPPLAFGGSWAICCRLLSALLVPDNSFCLCLGHDGYLVFSQYRCPT